MTIEYSPLAEGDADRIFLDGCERFGPSRAGVLIARIDETLQKTIGAFPNAARKRPELGLDVRSFPIVPYVAFYRVAGKRIEILRILHGHRDIKDPLLSLLLAG
jgi:toxin ParE1/3/4